mgnify:CR=1 FL=1
MSNWYEDLNFAEEAEIAEDHHHNKINSSGNPGLAKAGSGDILSGMIASFVSQGISMEKSTKLAAFIHGKTSDIISNQKGFRGQNPSDLLKSIPSVIMKYENI